MRSLLTAGALDATFGVNGLVQTDVTSGSDIGLSVATQADGKIVAAGVAYSLSNTDADIVITRYLGNGALDPTFGSGGIVTTSLGSAFDEAFSVAIQPDGKVVVAGRTNSSGNYQFFVTRYNSDGSLDSSFDGDGIVTTSVGGLQDMGRVVLLQPDGKIVVAGDSYNGSNNDFALVRYNTNGSLDSTFGVGGKVTTDLGGYESLTSAALQADGKIVTGGFKTGHLLIRYNADGSLDSTFDGDGVVELTGSMAGASVEAIAMQADGKIITTGETIVGADIGVALVRYNQDGTLDPQFDGDGIAVSVSAGIYQFASAIAVQPNGRIVVGGGANSPTSGTAHDFMLLRYNSDGTPDTSFDGDGKVVTAISTDSDFLRGIVLQNDGKIVATGGNSTATGDLRVARYEGDLVVPPLSFLITPKDDVPQIKLEGDSGQVAFRYVISRTGDLSQAAAVDYSVTAITSGLNADDFSGRTLPTGHVTFSAGQASSSVVIWVKGDKTVEPDEQFQVTLANPSPGYVMSGSPAVGTIVSDDTTISIQAIDNALPEGNSGFTVFRFSVTRTGGLSSPASVPYLVTGYSAHAANRFDFGGTLPSGIVTFAAGESTQLILVSVAGDLTFERNEDFAVRLTRAPVNHTILNQFALSTIVNDDSFCGWNLPRSGDTDLFFAGDDFGWW